MRFNGYQAALFVAAAMALHATAGAADKAAMSYDPAAFDDAAPALVAGCAVNLVEVSDGRSNRETIGNDTRPILADDVLPWIGNAVDRLGAHGYAVQRGKAPVAGAINLRVSLLRAYTFHAPMRINGVVAVDVEVAVPGQPSSHHKFRSLGSKSNMADMTSEFVTALNYAANNTMDKMARGLVPYCAGARAG